MAPYQYKSLQGNVAGRPLTLSTIFSGMTPSAIPFTTVTRSLPNNTGTYQAPVVDQTSPVQTTPVQTTPVKTNPAQTQTVQTPPAPTQPAPIDYSKYTDPVTGKVMTPQEYANYLANKKAGGSIPSYAGDAITQGPQSTQQLQSTATDLNNQRNDIATGTTDPYGVASKSGIAYSPQELTAIEKAYAGIYDPALKDVFAKLDKKQKQDEADLQLKRDLQKMAQQHQYDVELKSTPTATEKANLALGGLGGTYTPGANPVVDAWAQRIFDGTAKITDIPATEKGLRNAVTVALQANGNQMNGKPTTSALGLQALTTAKDIMDKFSKGQGTSAVGGSRFFGGALAANTPGTDAYNLANDVNTLKSQLSLDAVKYLKGQGAVSDAERALLSAAVTKLNLSQSEDEFKSTLQGIIDSLNNGIPDSTDTSSGGSTGFQVTDPDGGVHTFSTQADADAFKKAIGVK